MQHLDIYAFPQRELGHERTELKQHHNDFGDKEELVQNNNYNGNDPWKMLALVSSLNPKIMCTPTAKKIDLM